LAVQNAQPQTSQSPVHTSAQYGHGAQHDAAALEAGDVEADITIPAADKLMTETNNPSLANMDILLGE
jgi:hypothetical protein